MSREPDVKTYWNGEECIARRGTGVVADAPEFPQYWARTEGIVGQRIPFVRVVYAGSFFDIDDRDGKGWEKVTTRRGSPSCGHRNVKIELFSVEPYTQEAQS